MSAILQLVIGLVFIYSLMAILVTQINAVISSYLNMRAKNLRESLANLISDERLQAEILSHPLIKLIDPEKSNLLSLELDNKGKNEVMRAKLTRVDYIAPATFVESLVGLLVVRAYNSIDTALKTLTDDETRTRLEHQTRDFITTPSDEQLGVLRQSIASAEALGMDVKKVKELYDQFALSFSEIRNRSGDLLPLLMGIATINVPAFRDAIRMVLFSATNAAEGIKKLEAWFDGGMSRATTIFREKLQFISIIASVVLVVVLNIDTLAMTRAFWIDPTLRDAVATAAESFIESVPAADAIDPATDATTPPSDATVPADEQQAVQDSLNDARATVNQLMTLSVPMGWSWVEADCTSSDADIQRICESPNNLRNFIDSSNPNWASLVIGKIIGLIASAIAAAQGAPFWFDLLRKLTARN